ncbi:undecaprenyl-diphosphate phosphatase [Oribacterium sp. oral taxon 102]|uniref:undecaprenyl-diphosphate phosphatase n=1 Tax=Oribacterium sp. oral taxon 102 TaxID=671214 RepID=UPI0015BE50A3|nr:undecaprenyl-diphosphate phosphatase [Oribacterium sp. oral taxon 102]NWO20987.1 undecaprenyl-diphosphate phosphatase [Oribacterium sp. oral taxon 102]
MNIIEILKVIILGMVEGFTEWLPISSTGHMILVNEIIHLHQPEDFVSVFLVVIQLGAILAVLFRFFHQLWPLARSRRSGRVGLLPSKMQLWIKIIAACVPAAVLGLLFDDILDKYLYNGFVVALMLILYGIFFLVLERQNETKEFTVESLHELDLRTAFLIGLFQCLALIPGTSRSGATILGAMLLGVARIPAAEFSFFLSVPVMFGASLLKLVKHGLLFSGSQWLYLLLACLVAFLVSLYCINFLMRYIRNHSFAIFGYYRIVLGILVLLWFLVSRLTG